MGVGGGYYRLLYISEQNILFPHAVSDRFDFIFSLRKQGTEVTFIKTEVTFCTTNSDFWKRVKM